MRVLAALALCAAAAVAEIAHAGEARTLDLGNGKLLHYSTIDAAESVRSARSAATHLMGFLASGRLEEAAALSNAPQRRLEVLQEYRAVVGEEELKRVFAQILNASNGPVAEFAIDGHRLLVWDLGGASAHLAAQYYVEVEGRFLMDDVPSETRSSLRQLLQAYRKEKQPPLPALAPRP